MCELPEKAISSPLIGQTIKIKRQSQSIMTSTGCHQLPRLTLTVLLLIFAVSTLESQTYTFTNAGATGRTGPTQSQVNSAYTSGNTLHGAVTINTQGIQEWTVPATGIYTIEVWGAQGGGTYGGKGARMKGDFDLNQGDMIKIVVGQQGGTAGSNNTTSGGGGSFVIISPYNSNSAILVIAGGGGGSPGSSDYQSGGYDDGQTGTSGARGYGASAYSVGG
ncbi:MAG: glycine-rich protein, partial [Nitrospinaceae bacterium]|nr:glycine-rich protein [Nitrospinaceae bacterium]